jgi:integrase
MALTRLPAYVRPTKLTGGEIGHYWELPHWARPIKDPKTGKLTPAMRHGQACPVQSETLGADLAVVHAKAETLNAALREWRRGEMGAGKLAEGSVAWLFAWYRDQERFTKNKAKTRKDYRALMDMLVAFETKAGQPPLGKRMASKVDATVADKLYSKLKDKGARQATYAMQVCRLVWTWAARHHRITGVKENPFKGMGLKSTAAAGNRETSRAEYNLYRETARKLGFQSMATAAALCFECCQRVWDAFGFEDPDGVERRGIEWAGYQPGVAISLIQSKTGNPVVLPLSIDVAGIGDEPGERVSLYPELEEELARSRAVVAAGAEVIVLEERSGKKYKERRMSSVHRRICTEAGLPKDMTFTGFRHGGITEIGDAGEDDVRAVSGHKTLAVTQIYNKASAEKARRIGAARREHIAALGGEIAK